MTNHTTPGVDLDSVASASRDGEMDREPAEDWKARAIHAENMLRVRNRQIATTRRFWCRAAESALAGDTRELRNRLEMCLAEPVEIVLSDTPHD